MKVTDNETRWAKIGKIPDLAFVGKETLFFGAGCHLVFVNLSNGEELIYAANNSRTGDGVKCYTGNRSQNVFAFAENRTNAAIFIKTYPNFEEIYRLKDENVKGYVAMVFSETSLLITLGDLPSFYLTVWNWRQGEKIASQEGGILMADQMLKCNFGSPVFLAQLGLQTKILHLWDIYICGKKCVLTQHTTHIEQKCEEFTSILWTTEGGLFALDSTGSVYTMFPDYHLEKVIDFVNPDVGNHSGRSPAPKYPTTFAWYKSGIVVAGPNAEIRHYKKSGTWSMDWSMTQQEPVLKLVARFEYLIILTEYSNIIQVLPGQNELKYIREDGHMSDFCLIYPTGKYAMVLRRSSQVHLYAVATGELISTYRTTPNATLIVENPKFPYAALGCIQGVVLLVSAYNPKNLAPLAAFNLTKDPIDSIHFNDCGTVFVAASLNVGTFFVIQGIPGGQMQITCTIDTKCQIADQMMIVSQDCYRIFMIPVTSSQYVAGNTVLRYCIVKDKGVDVKRYAFEDANILCNRIIATTGPSRDRVFYVLLSDSKMINEVEIKKGSVTAHVRNAIVTGHQMRDVHLRLDQRSALTWSYDGLVIARSSDFATNIAICLPHHRYLGGVQKAYICPYQKYIVSLGRDGVLICTNLMEREIDPHLQSHLEHIHESKDYKTIFSRPTTGFVPAGKYQGKCYLQVEELKRVEKEETRCHAEKSLILAEFQSIQKELQELLTANLLGPENEKLALGEFNLNVKLFEEKATRNKRLCKATEIYLRHLIEAQDKISEFMIANFWEKMSVPGTAIKAIFAKFEVTNYVLRPPNANIKEMLAWIRQQRKLERYLNEMTSFRPWEPIAEEKLLKLINAAPQIPKKDEQMAIISALEGDAPEILEEEEEDQESKIAFSGTDTARFIEIQDVNYLQNELITYFQTELQWSISKSDCYRLKDFFNAKFDKVMDVKLKEMGNIKQKNDRLRRIVSELNHFSEDKVQMRIEDPEWKQIETPELITKVKDNEVPITPYVSPSAQAILDAKAAEAERLRLLLLADDFRERALMAMMNGVLEVRWEDELRKEVPLPKCMIEKEPEAFNEDDLRAVKDYEEKVTFLNSERERYKTMLRAEYGKLAQAVRDNIKKFNGKLNELLCLKLGVDAALSQESLKIHRLKLYQHRRKAMLDREQQIAQKIAQNDELIASLQKLLHTLHDSISECRNYVESFQVKDKFLEKAYKKDFQEMSIVVQEQASKLFKKRPKTNFRLISSSTLLNELAKCIVYGAKPSPVLNSDCVEFLKQMENLDLYLGVPTVVDEHTYALICKHRRLRIEYEVKLRAAQTELSEAEATFAAFQKRLHQKKELNVKLHNDLVAVREGLVTVTCNTEMQIVLPRGLVEIPLTGTLRDFEDAILICRKDVENINSIILKFGGNKIKALHQGMNFRRRILAVEWEHRRMRMLIQDLQEKIIDIDGVKLTKEIQFYLKVKDKEKTIPFETEVDMIKASYENTIQDRKDVVNRMKKQIRGIKEHDKTLEQKIKEVNVDVCEFGMLKDKELDEKERAVIDTRMKTLLKRSRLVQQVQENHHEILMLQTELELLRLKTFPTLKYKLV